MTELLLDARTINAVLNALNQPIGNATEACAIVRDLALFNSALKLSDDTELSKGDFSPWMGRGEMVKRAIQALDDLEDWCQQNEAQWTGWGDQIVPEGTIRWTKQAKLALDLIRDNVAPDVQVHDVVSSYVSEMKTTAGTDYYVTVRFGDRTLTPHMFKQRGKAEYEVAEWNWLINGGEQPDILAFAIDDVPEKLSELISVTVSHGKYTIQQTDHGRWEALRHGSHWPAMASGPDNLHVALAYEIDTLRRRVASMSAPEGTFPWALNKMLWESCDMIRESCPHIKFMFDGAEDEDCTFWTMNYETDDLLRHAFTVEEILAKDWKEFAR